MCESKTKENKEKKVPFAEDVKQPSEAGMMCIIDGNTFFCSQRICGSEIWVHHAKSPTRILASMMSPTLTNQSKVAPVLCPQQKGQAMSQGVASQRS